MRSSLKKGYHPLDEVQKGRVFKQGNFCCGFRGNTVHVHLKVIGIPPLTPVQNSVSLKLMQRKILNFVINLPDVENITK